MMTVQYRILKSHINKNGIKVIDKIKIDSVGLTGDKFENSANREK